MQRLVIVGSLTFFLCLRWVLVFWKSFSRHAWVLFGGSSTRDFYECRLDVRLSQAYLYFWLLWYGFEVNFIMREPIKYGESTIAQSRMMLLEFVHADTTNPTFRPATPGYGWPICAYVNQSIGEDLYIANYSGPCQSRLHTPEL